MAAGRISRRRLARFFGGTARESALYPLFVFCGLCGRAFQKSFRRNDGLNGQRRGKAIEADAARHRRLPGLLPAIGLRLLRPVANAAADVQRRQRALHRGPIASGAVSGPTPLGLPGAPPRSGPGVTPPTAKPSHEGAYTPDLRARRGPVRVGEAHETESSYAPPAAHSGID